MRILGIDPGENTGYAIVNLDAAERQMSIQDTGTVRMAAHSYAPALAFFLRTVPEVDLVVCENYVINPKVYGHSHQGDKGIALRQIGALEVLALQNKIDCVLQMPTVKPPGYGFLGKKYVRGKKEMHGFDALAHVMYYLVSTNSVQPL